MISGDLYGVAEFCRKALEIPEHILITISKCCLKEDNVLGWSYSDYNEDFGYEIELEHSLSLKDLLVTLCHEMVHIKQYTDGKVSNEDEAEALEEKLYNAWHYRSSLL